MARSNYTLIILAVIATVAIVALTPTTTYAQIADSVYTVQAEFAAPDSPYDSARLDCANLPSSVSLSAIADNCGQVQFVATVGMVPQPGALAFPVAGPPSGEPVRLSDEPEGPPVSDNRAPANTRVNRDMETLAAAIPVPEPVATTNVVKPLFLVPIGQDIRIRAQPMNGQVIHVVGAGEVIQVLEPAESAQQKIGVRDQWLAVRALDGTEGYTAAWLYQIANAVTPEVAAALTTPVPTAPPTQASATALFIRAETDGVFVRTRPVDGAIVSSVFQGEVVQVIEPIDTARTKIGVPENWVEVRTPDGQEGYTAAWLYTIEQPVSAQTSALTPDTSLPSATNLESASTSVFLTPVGNDIRIRNAPVNGQVIDVVDQGELLEVTESPTNALGKIGVRGEWVEVRTADGTEGFTAAWLYDVASPAPDEPTLQPLDEQSGATSLDLSPDNGGVPQVLPVEQVIPPLENTIASLDVQQSTGQDTIVAAVGENMANVAPVQEASAAAMTEQLPDVAASVAQAPALNDNPAPRVAPTGPLADQPSLKLFNPVKPVSIDLLDDITFHRVDIAINDYPLASFTEPPFEFDLDTMLLQEGEYKLAFSVIGVDGMEWSDDVYFKVDVADATPSPVVEASLASTSLTPETTGAERTILIDDVERPLTFEFSTEMGLTPVEINAVATPEVARVDQPDSLIDVLTSPIVSVIPAPAREYLTRDRPTVAAIAILIMVFILIPQGIFTIYWMTYTWNNPEAADLYRSPSEFVEPQYSFTAMVPARHEESVIKDTIRAVDRINYPDHLKEILILIRDENDDATIRAANDVIHELGKSNIRLITFKDGPRNKPNGLNKGLAEASNDVVCIFDAEDEPHADIYNVVNTVMVRDEADVVQSGVQLMNFRSSWFSAFNVLEYFFWFKSGLHAFTRQFQVTPLGGNTVFFKRFWLERMDGWDDQCLTEDADVGLRLTQMGAKIQIVYEAEHATQEETPDTVESFIKQRTRWSQGFYQIFFKWDWARLPTLKQKIVALYILLNSLLQALMIVFIPIGLFIALTQDVPVPIALISYIPIYILVLQLIISLIGIREFAAAYNERLPMFFTLRMIVFYYPYQLLLSIASFRAVIRFLIGEQAWEKTAHSNLHRQEQLSGVA